MFDFLFNTSNGEIYRSFFQILISESKFILANFSKGQFFKSNNKSEMHLPVIKEGLFSSWWQNQEAFEFRFLPIESGTNQSTNWPFFENWWCPWKKLIFEVIYKCLELACNFAFENGQKFLWNFEGQCAVVFDSSPTVHH